MPIVIRPQSPDEAAPLSRLEGEIFDCDLISLASFRRFARSESCASLVAKSNGEIAGYAIVLFRKGSSTGRIYSIATAPAFRSQGLGKRLLEACESAAKSRGCAALRLEVKVDNAEAIAFYERFGYTLDRRVPNYYEDGTDALSFSKPI